MLILQLAASVFITPKLHRHILVSEVPSAALTEGELWPLSSGVPVPRVLAAHAQQGGVWAHGPAPSRAAAPAGSGRRTRVGPQHSQRTLPGIQDRSHRLAGLHRGPASQPRHSAPTPAPNAPGGPHIPRSIKGQVKETCDPRTFKHRERSSQGGFRGAVGPNTRAVLNWI